MTTLTFPNPEGFIKYLKEQRIHRYGIVAICEVSPSDQIGAAIYKERFRLSSIDDNKKELLICEVPYYRSIYVTEEYNQKEAKQAKEKMLAALEKSIKEWTEGYDLKLLECQFGE